MASEISRLPGRFPLASRLTLPYIKGMTHLAPRWTQVRVGRKTYNVTHAIRQNGRTVATVHNAKGEHVGQTVDCDDSFQAVAAGVALARKL
jgi:hypothetical protein